MSTYKGIDECTDLILDLISSDESNGNYNAVIGDSAASDDLSKKTISDIYELQNYLYFTLHRPSTAVGRYQIIRGTLKNLQEKSHLPSDSFFTPELQDKLAVQLLVGRGYRLWWTNKISSREFAHRISMEWASLPDPYNGGKSHYDGVGPNHSRMSLGHVLDVLKLARTKI